MPPKLMTHEERVQWLLVPIRLVTTVPAKSWGGVQVRERVPTRHLQSPAMFDDSYIRYSAPDDANQGEL